jgi:hypothetical protein
VAADIRPHGVEVARREEAQFLGAAGEFLGR